MSGKKFMRNLFSGKVVDRVPMLLPIIPLGAKIMQVSTSAIALDPALIVQCALQIKQLLAPQGMVLYDPSTLVEAMGGTLKSGMSFPEKAKQAGNVPLTLETTQRLSATLGRDSAVFAAVPGPVEMVLLMSEADESEQYINDQNMMASITSFLIDLAKEYMENRADGLVVVESNKFFAKEEFASLFNQFLTTVGNMADYYGIPLIIHLHGDADADPLPSSINTLNFKGLSLDGNIKPNLLSNALEMVSDKVIVLTISEDLLVHMGLENYLKELNANLVGKRFMLSIPWTMSEDLSVAHVLGLKHLL